MANRLRDRWLVLTAAFKRPWVRAIGLLFSIIGFWDTFAAQLLPKSLAKKLPTVYEAAEMTTGLLPWFWWVIIGLALLLVVVLDFAVRQNRRSGNFGAASALHQQGAAIPYRDWSRLSAIDLETAAAIWSGTRDVNDVVRHLRFRELKQAVREGRLVAKSKAGGRVNRDTQVTPAELEKFLRALSPETAVIAQADEPHLPDMKIADLARSHLGIEDFLTPDPDGKIGRFLYAIREAALHERIRIWGRRDCEQGMEDLDIIPREQIPAAYWRNCKINEYSFITEDGWAATTADGGECCESYADLQVSRQQVEKIWPAVNT